MQEKLPLFSCRSKGEAERDLVRHTKDQHSSQRHSREQYANNAHPKWAYFGLNSPKTEGAQNLYYQLHPLIPNHLAELSGSPEKAGVGGSIPSLATFTYAPLHFSVAGPTIDEKLTIRRR
jgi:hypothetical protein